MHPDKSYVSPNGRYRLDLFAHEVRMSHWLNCPYLYDTASGELLFSAGQYWDTLKLEWVENGNGLSLALRHYSAPSNQVRVLLDMANQRSEIYSDTHRLFWGSLDAVRSELSNTSDYRNLYC